MGERPDGRLPLRVHARHHKPQNWQMQAGLLVGGAAALFLLLASSVPTELVLPIFSGVALATGLITALVGWYFGIRQDPDRITCWDVASTCVFVGFAAGLMSNPEQVMQLSALPAGND